MLSFSLIPSSVQKSDFKMLSNLVLLVCITKAVVSKSEVKNSYVVGLLPDPVYVSFVTIKFVFMRFHFYGGPPRTVDEETR